LFYGTETNPRNKLGRCKEQLYQKRTINQKEQVMKAITKRDSKRREVKNPRIREQNKARFLFKQKQYKMEEELYCS